MACLKWSSPPVTISVPLTSRQRMPKSLKRNYAKWSSRSILSVNPGCTAMQGLLFRAIPYRLFQSHLQGLLRGNIHRPERGRPMRFAETTNAKTLRLPILTGSTHSIWLSSSTSHHSRKSCNEMYEPHKTVNSNAKKPSNWQMMLSRCSSNNASRGNHLTLFPPPLQRHCNRWLSTQGIKGNREQDRRSARVMVHLPLSEVV